jgi:hypothetical protein
MLAYPLSAPFQYGELAESASSVGSQGATQATTAIARSRSATSTCTWAPQMSCSRAST